MKLEKTETNEYGQVRYTYRMELSRAEARWLESDGALEYFRRRLQAALAASTAELLRLYR